MLEFNTKLAVHVTANSENERIAYANMFSEHFGSFNRIDSIGGWVSNTQVITEPDIVITAWMPDSPDNLSKVEKLFELLKDYQDAAGQEAVSLEVTSPDGWMAFILFQDDWNEGNLNRILQKVDKGLALSLYFEKSKVQA